MGSRTKRALTAAVAFAAVSVVGGTPPAGATPLRYTWDWGAGLIPEHTSFDDADAVELGMRFHVVAIDDVQVDGMRFYKGIGNTGTHIGSLWTSSGALLARVQFTSETPTGSQAAYFSKPVHIAADTDYVVSYHAPHGHYAVDWSMFFDGDVQGVGPLWAPSEGGQFATNGRFTYTTKPGTFPTSSYIAHGYGVYPIISTNYDFATCYSYVPRVNHCN